MTSICLEPANMVSLYATSIVPVEATSQTIQVHSKSRSQEEEGIVPTSLIANLRPQTMMAMGSGCFQRSTQFCYTYSLGLIMSWASSFQLPLVRVGPD